MYDYLVTTYATDIPKDKQIVMVDGTVPGWEPKPGDLHFDHHRPGGQPVQIMEIPADTRIENAIFVTTQVDADACCAAAWLQLIQRNNVSPEKLGEIYTKLSAIAYDCDHLGVSNYLSEYAEFARNAVAALKLSGKQIVKDLGFPADRKSWSAEQKRAYASEAFRKGTEYLVEAALGDRPWPGECGEAKTYWTQYEAQKPMLASRFRMYKSVGIFDSRGISEYIDPRHLLEWVRQQPDHINITLTVRDRPLELFHTEEKLILQKQGAEKLEDGDTEFQINLSAFTYTLGCVPLHKSGSPKFSDRNVWEALSKAEQNKRYFLNLPMPTGGWGGRNEVGGSSWNDAAILFPEEVIDCVLPLISG